MPASTTAASQKIALNQPSVCTAPTTEPALNNAQAPVWTATSAFSPMACIPTRTAAARQGGGERVPQSKIWTTVLPSPVWWHAARGKESSTLSGQGQVLVPVLREPWRVPL